MVSVIRARNAALVTDLIRQCDPAQVRLWALDRVPAELSDFAIGVGPGGRFELLNRLVKTVDDDRPVVVCDDDVTFYRGQLGDLVASAEAAGFQLAQPAHARASYCTYPLFRRRWWARARRTTFVEIGPIVYVSVEGRRRFTPFPTDTPMGWGVDLLWRDHALSGVPIGVIDDVTVSHHSPVGGGYNQAVEAAHLEAMMAERRLRRMVDSQRTLTTWPRWRAKAPRALSSSSSN